MEGQDCSEGQTPGCAMRMGAKGRSDRKKKTKKTPPKTTPTNLTYLPPCFLRHVEMAAASAYPSHLQTFPTPSLIRGFLLSVLIPNPRVNPAPGLRVWNRHLTFGLFLMFRNMNKSHTIKFIIFPPQRNMKYYRSSSLHQFLHSLLASKVYFSYNLPSHWSNFSYFFWSRKHTEHVLLLHITHNPSCPPSQGSKKLLELASSSRWSRSWVSL